MKISCWAGRAAGSIAVLLFGGDATGEAQLSAERNAFWDQSTAFSSLASHEDNDRLGAALAAGDFNGDGWDDLAIGSPGEDIGALDSAGAVFVIYGGEDGLQQRTGSTAGNAAEAFNQDTLESAGDTLGGGAEVDDEFGAVLAAGDFDGDGFDDLAIGTPNENLEDPPIPDVGYVAVIYGSAAGLRAADSTFRFQVWDADRFPSLVSAESRFGAAFAVGDFDDDGVDDLAVGAPGDYFYGKETVAAAGSVTVYRGEEGTGQVEEGRLRFFKNPDAVYGGPADNDAYGSRLASGDFDGDSVADLAIAIPWDFPLAEAPLRGSIETRFGHSGGFTLAGEVIGVGAESGEIHLAVCNFNEDGLDDLAVAFINVLGPIPWGIDIYFANDSYEFDRWSEASYAVDEVRSLACGPLDGPAPVRLVVGGELGGVLELEVSPEVGGERVWKQGEGGLVEATEALDNFGAALAIGEFGLGAGLDLAVGIPLEDSNSRTDNGAFHLLYNRILLIDSFESGNVVHWSGALGLDPGEG